MLTLRRLAYILIASLTLSVMTTSCGTTRKTTSSAHSVKPHKRPDLEKKDRHHGPAATHDLAQALIDEARTWLGTPYRYGGKDKSGTDCSGFIMQLYKTVTNVNVPRNSRAQWDYCEALDKKDLAVGDLIFFSSKNSGGDIAHVGMYIGDGTMIHASSSRGVTESNIGSNYFVEHYIGSGRVPVIAQLVPVPRPVPRPITPVDILPVPDSPPVAEVPEPAPVNPEPIVLIAEPTPEPAPTPASVVKNAFGRAH